ncbi:MAG: FMN-binding protein [Alkalispirochaeta sp.]
MARNTILYTVSFSFILTFSIAMVLSAAHNATQPRVIDGIRAHRQGAVLRAMGNDAVTREEIFEAYAELVSPRPGVYVDLESETGRVATVFSGPGVWGEISGVVGIQVDEMRVISVEILDHRETPGLGGRVADPRFLDQFKGEQIGPDGIHVVLRGPGNDDPDDQTVDGITGASGTTRAFDRIINTYLADTAWTEDL